MRTTITTPGAFLNPLSRFSKLTSTPEDFWCCVYGLRLGVISIIFSESAMAEGVGFEPTSRFRETVFKTAAFSHSAIPPMSRSGGIRLTCNLQFVSCISSATYHRHGMICYQLLAGRGLVTPLNNDFYQLQKSPSSNTLH